MVTIITNDGKATATRKLPTETRKIIDYIEGLDDDQVIETKALATNLGYFRFNLPNHPALWKYRLRVPGRSVIWGKPAALQAFRKEMETYGI